MKTQKGIALIVSMVVLLVAALFGVSSFQSAQLEERMAGNHRFSVSALQAAEAGVNDMLDAVLAFNYVAGGATFCDSIGSALSVDDWSESPSGSGAYATAGEISGGGLTKTYSAIMKCQSAGVDSAHVIGYSRGVVPDGDPDSDYETARLVKVEIVPPGYDAFKSMLADGNIDIQGNSVINGDVHSNGDLSLAIRTQGNIKVESSGSVTASGTADFEVPAAADGEDCTTYVCTASGVPEIPVPDAQSYIDYITDGAFDDAGELIGGGFIEVDDVNGGWKVVDSAAGAIEVLPHDPVTGDCSSTGSPLVKPDGFVADEYQIELDNNVKIINKNYIYYCPGNLDTGDDFVGVTVMAAGNITHRGSATVAAEALVDADGNPIVDADGNPIGVDTLVVSGGAIELNGATDTETYAAFWSVGDFTQNGNSAIYGSIVAGGSIVNNGGIEFSSVDSSTLYQPVSGRLEGWAELEDPGDTSDLAGFVN
ncbi:pilus assembly PilX family protein [Halomonas denitrificans]|uniref:pilus assembly PilX family protein n=1 Tax=Halomonas denitrificans TaxID=370769 RepID=UPI000D3D6394|nr:PilX N-terminal domain-containing pilus assembly protein [Halomonas denitrificans]